MTLKFKRLEPLICADGKAKCPSAPKDIDIDTMSRHTERILLILRLNFLFDSRSSVLLFRDVRDSFEW